MCFVPTSLSSLLIFSELFLTWRSGPFQQLTNSTNPLAVCGICRSRFSRSCCSRIPPCAEALQTCSPTSSICWAAPSGPTGTRLISSRQSDISLRFTFHKQTSIMFWIFAGASTQHDRWIQHDRSQFEPWRWKSGQSDQFIGDLSKCKRFVTRNSATKRYVSSQTRSTCPCWRVRPLLCRRSNTQPICSPSARQSPPLWPLPLWTIRVASFSIPRSPSFDSSGKLCKTEDAPPRRRHNSRRVVF